MPVHEIDAGHAALRVLTEFARADLPAGANEAETRLKLIDRMLLEVLGWKLEDLSVEERVSEDGETTFADYVLRTLTTAVVIEAKKVGVPWDVPRRVSSLRLGGALSEGDLGKAIRQARDYARSKGIPFAVATNGHSWIVFPATRIDQVSFDDSQAKVFRSLEEIQSRIVEFWELLSRQRVLEGGLESSLIRRRPDVLARQVLSEIVDAGFRIGRNSAYSQIEPAVVQALSDEQILQDPDALEACYVSTSERTKYDERLQVYLNDSKPALDRGVVRVRNRKSTQYLDSEIDSQRPGLSRAYVLIGSVGSGKTTFLHHTRKVSARKLIDGRLLWLLVDFKRATAEDNPRTFIFRELLAAIESDQEFDLGDFKSGIRPAYEDVIENLKRGPLFLIAQRDPAGFETRVADQIQREREELVPYVTRILTHQAAKVGGFLVIDNVDQIEGDAVQERIFLEAQAAARNMGLNLAISLRESTFQKNRNSPAFNAFQFETLYIDAPQVIPVLSRRFRYAERVLAGRGCDFMTEGGIRLKVDDLGVFFELVASSLLDEESGRMIEMLSGGDVRRGLLLVREFLASGHISADKALHAYLSSGEYHFPRHEVFRGAILGARKYYSERESLLPNLFDSKLDVREMQLLRLRILSWFLTRARTGPQEPVPLHDLAEMLDRLGVQEDDLDRTVGDLCKFRLLRTHDGGECLRSSRLVVTQFAGYLLLELSHLFAYFEMCSLESLIHDGDDFRELVQVTRSIEAAHGMDKINLRVQRCQKYLTYLERLEDQWLLECNRRGVEDDWTRPFVRESLAPLLKVEFGSVIRSATRQRSRKD